MYKYILIFIQCSYRLEVQDSIPRTARNVFLFTTTYRTALKLIRALIKSVQEDSFARENMGQKHEAGHLAVSKANVKNAQNYIPKLSHESSWCQFKHPYWVMSTDIVDLVVFSLRRHNTPQLILVIYDCEKCDTIFVQSTNFDRFLSIAFTLMRTAC